MTSLGSVCREKINAAANQLGVDTEIVRVRAPFTGLTREIWVFCKAQTFNSRNLLLMLP